MKYIGIGGVIDDTITSFIKKALDGFYDIDYNWKIDSILEIYEEQAENENFYLLHFNLELQNSPNWLSPAGTFSPVIILKGDKNCLFFTNELTKFMF